MAPISLCMYRAQNKINSCIHRSISHNKDHYHYTQYSFEIKKKSKHESFQMFNMIRNTYNQTG